MRFNSFALLKVRVSCLVPRLPPTRRWLCGVVSGFVGADRAVFTRVPDAAQTGQRRKGQTQTARLGLECVAASRVMRGAAGVR